MKWRIVAAFLCLGLVSIPAALLYRSTIRVAPVARPFVPHTFGEKIAAAAQAQIGVTVGYNATYKVIPFPNGDVPMESGVCTDVVIRAFRQMGLDLQQLVFDDAKKHRGHYPRISKLDPNIDHRRCPNLASYMSRHFTKLPVDLSHGDGWKAGDIVFFKTANNLDHIGILSWQRNAAGVPLVIHNIGAGTQEEDLLPIWQPTLRFRHPDP